MTGSYPAMTDYRSAITLLIAVVVIAATSACEDWREERQLVEGKISDASCRIDMNRCSARFDDGTRISVRIEQSPVRPLEPLDFHVLVSGIEPKNITMDLVGITMNMGPNSFPLLNTSRQGEYAGQGMVPICIRDRMEWHAVVRMETPEKIYETPFRFDVSRR